MWFSGRVSLIKYKSLERNMKWWELSVPEGIPLVKGGQFFFREKWTVYKIGKKFGSGVDWRNFDRQ